MYPNFSVVIPAFNAATFVSQALDSVLNQTVPAHEVIVVDDGSTDNTVDVVQGWQKARETVIRIVKQQNAGAAAARNRGAMAATGIWILFLDSDDCLEPCALAAFSKGIAAAPEVKWVGADYRTTDIATGEIFIPSLVNRPRVSPMLRHAFDSNQPVLLARPWEHFLRANFTCMGANVIRRDTFVLSGGFREHLKIAEDYQLWIRLAAMTDFVFVPKLVMSYRARQSSLTNAPEPPRKWTKPAFRQLTELDGFNPKHAVFRQRYAEFERQDAVYFAKNRMIMEALGCCFRAIRQDCFHMQNWLLLLSVIVHPIRKPRALTGECL